MDKGKCYRNSETSINYVRKEDLIALNKKLLEKVGRDIRNKYGNLLNDKNLTIEYFENVFNNEIEKFYNYNQPNYAKFLQQVESLVLKKINKIDDKARGSLLQKKEVEKLCSDTSDKLSHLPEDTDKQSKIRNELKKKQDDDWAKIINNDYKSFMNEENSKLFKKCELKKEYKNDLDNLISNKKQLQQMNSSEDENISSNLIEQKSENEKAEKIFNNKILLEEIQKENFQKKHLVKHHLEHIKEEDRNAEKQIMIKIKGENLKMQELNEKKKTQEKQIQEYLKEQMEILREKEIKNKNQKIEERKVISCLSNQDLDKKQKEIETKRSSIIKYRNQLEKQIGLKQNEPMMNDVERMINKKLLKI